MPRNTTSTVVAKGDNAQILSLFKWVNEYQF